MTEKELKKIAAKIAKLLALASSDNPHEAAAAKRQADAMINKYNITTGDVQASRVHEQETTTGGKYRAPKYLGGLFTIIAQAFGCSAVGHPGWGWSQSKVVFMGLGIKPELASYTFEVLARHIKKDRKDYQARLKRFKPANKQRMADLFCQQWVLHIQQQVHEFAGTEEEKMAIEAYKKIKYDDRLQDDSRNTAQAKTNGDYEALMAGRKAAKDVSLHKPVQTRKNTLLEAG